MYALLTVFDTQTFNLKKKILIKSEVPYKSRDHIASVLARVFRRISRFSKQRYFSQSSKF